MLTGASQTTSAGFVERIEQKYPIDVLKTLLADRSTQGNILWADDEYEALGKGYQRNDEITLESITGVNSGVIKPRIAKELERQSQRTKSHAEVFTPSWLCNQMNNYLDEDWFGRKDVFTVEGERSWEPAEGPIEFPKKKGRGWQAYVDSPRLEITCGEAPFVCSRYDTVSGRPLPVPSRIGFLDRKLHVVSEKTKTRNDWGKWALRALRATYGYEYQGDNLILARINVLETLVEHCLERWGEQPSDSEIAQAAKVVSWNLWQMDGRTCAIPSGEPAAAVQPSLFELAKPEPEQMSMLDLLDDWAEPEQEEPAGESVPLCVIYNWEANEPVVFASLKSEEQQMKKFYAVIGNPPYQAESDGNGRKSPIYNDFMDAAYEIGSRVELITPGRFLFNAGQTPSAWNEKMLADKHLKVLSYESDASGVFYGTDIKGGVAITYRDESEEFGAIEVFTAYPELNSLIRKVHGASGKAARLDSLFASQRLYKFSDTFFDDNKQNPNVQRIMNSGTRTKIVSSFLGKMPDVFTRQQVKFDDVCLLCRIDNARQRRYVSRKYIRSNEYLDAYKLFIPEANNSGVYGEALAEPIVGKPGEGSADTFLNAGPFRSEDEAKHLALYYKTKFFRSLLGARKVTQHSPAQVWNTIPLQDFTSNSDIDWSKSIPEIDQQLYVKYGLDEDEISFVEAHVKEMS